MAPAKEGNRGIPHKVSIAAAKKVTGPNSRPNRSPSGQLKIVNVWPRGEEKSRHKNQAMYKPETRHGWLSRERSLLNSPRWRVHQIKTNRVLI
jgi:hypothetical protein